jgi:hypothetical protein
MDGLVQDQVSERGHAIVETARSDPRKEGVVVGNGHLDRAVRDGNDVAFSR